MQYHLTEELISAYIDGELTAAEQALVEQGLADSAEHQQLYDELLDLRSDLQSLPRFALPDDFHKRVLREAERRSLAPATSTSPTPASLTPEPQDPAKLRLRTWQSIAVAAAGLAVALLLALIIVSKSGDPGLLPKDDQIVDTPDRRDGPGANTSQLVSLWDRPRLVFVIDLTITPDGQQKKVFEAALTNVGIPFDASIKVDEGLEEVLLASRFIGDVQRAAAGQEAADDVELVYVTGTGRQIDAAAADFHTRQSEVAQVKYDLAIDPEERDVFKRMRNTVQLASEDPRGARRLKFSFALQSSSAGVVGAIQPPTLRLQTLSDEDSSENSTSQIQGREASLSGTSNSTPRTSTQTGGEIAALDMAAGEDEELEVLYEVLFILRNMRAHAADPE